jgi:hypothetical protein
MADCQACSHPVPDVAYVCPACERDLAAQLRDAAELWPELQVTVARLARMSEPGPRARGRAPAQPIRPDGRTGHYADQVVGAVTGLPFSWAAAHVAEDVRKAVITWCQMVLRERGGRQPPTIPASMLWLADQLGWLRYQRDAAQAWEDLGLCRLIRPAVDRPPLRARVKVGPCPEVVDGGRCAGQVTAVVPVQQDRPALMVCNTCGAQWPTAQWARAGRRILAVTREATCA